MGFWLFEHGHATPRERTADEQEDYEQFMMGFRLGCPVEGDPAPTIPATDHPAFQRGRAAGRAVSQRHQHGCTTGFHLMQGGQ